MKFYKVLSEGGAAYRGGTGVWHLPKGKRPGKWMPPIPKPKPYVRGYNVCRREDLVEWLGPEIYEVEIRGVKIQVIDKTVVEQARLLRRLDTWTERTARLFACDCAERALALTDSPDQRSVEAISVARRFANGAATKQELAAARDAAWDAATEWQAATKAADDAAWAATAGTAAWQVADNAAWAADNAWQAAVAAARATADAAWDAVAVGWDSERKWQTRRLFEYLNGERGK